MILFLCISGWGWEWNWGRALQEMMHMQHTSPGENSSKTDDKTSSESADVRREVTRPKPFAADHRTTVSWGSMQHQ